MSTSFNHNSWSRSTTLTDISTTAPLPCTSSQAPGTPLVPGSGSSAIPVGTAKYWAQVSQMELIMTEILACLAVIEQGSQIAAAAAQTASKCSIQSNSNTPLAIPLAWDLPPTNGQAQRYEYALKIPDSLVSHVIGHQGQGLKQAHDLSGSQFAVFAVSPARNEGRWFITIRGTDQHIGEALVVIGKHIAKCRVHTPQKQKTGNAALGVAALAPSLSNSLSTSKPPTQQTRPLPTPTLS
ncbi:hypothetical protein C0995_008678 [Termitomyces sp. Mi166|nr:hypothetical protein C0995_008678 [Termitomyces sp. Mi166\